MDAYLNASISDNTKLLPDLLRSLEKEKDSLNKQLSGVGSREGESGWLKVITDVKSTINDLESLRSQAMPLARGDAVSGEGGACVESLKPLVDELAELERLQFYLTWMKKINHLCQQMEGQLASGHFSEVLSTFFHLSSLCTTLAKSNCSNLKHYAMASKSYWHTRLKEKLSSDFGGVLKELQWPFTTSAVSSKALDSWNKREKKFTELFTLLIKLDDRGSLIETDVTAAMLSDPILLPLELTIQPLRKRFKYHFFGSRKTNSKEKPEWYLTQVSSWIRDHSHFLEDRIQPLLHMSGYSQVDARLEFIRGLLQEVEEKLQADLSEVVYEDSLMSHLIDELLVFERELRTVLQYPRPCPSPFQVLLGEVPFHKWLTLEKAFAIERMNSIATSESAWQPAYDGMTDADDTRVPQCTEGFMELIRGITERYNSIPSTRHQLQFLELQRDLLLEFHHDLCENANKTGLVPLDAQFVAYMNASNYIAVVLRDWGEQAFYLELHYHTKGLSVDSTQQSDTRPLPLHSIQLLRQQDPDYSLSEGSVFSAVIETFSTLVKKLEEALVRCVLESVRLKCHQYKKEKWHSMTPTGKDQISKDATQSAAELSSLLSEHLLFIEDNLSPLLAPDVFEKISEKVDQLIFSEVVLSSHFSEGGAEQLHFDLTAVLLPLLSKFNDEMTRRQLMERTLEACKLLQLLPGSAKLLQELLQGAVRRSTVNDETYSAAVTALNDMGIHSIDPTQAEQILKLRILPS